VNPWRHNERGARRWDEREEHREKRLNAKGSKVSNCDRNTQFLLRGSSRRCVLRPDLVPRRRRVDSTDESGWGFATVINSASAILRDFRAYAFQSVPGIRALALLSVAGVAALAFGTAGGCYSRVVEAHGFGAGEMNVQSEEGSTSYLDRLIEKGGNKAPGKGKRGR